MTLRRLLIRPGAIGDVILALPALEAARADETEVWAPSRSVPLIRFGARVRSIASTGLERLGLGDDSALDLLRGFDSIWSWYGSNRDDFRRAVAGLSFRFFPALPPKDSRVHAADFFLQQVGGTPPAVPRIPCAAAPENFTAIHPFSGGAHKNWPLERFRELANHLSGPLRWFVGGEQSLAGAEHIEDLFELASILARSRVTVGNDSGITHLAAAAGAPVVALFGPTDPALWAPRGERVVVVKRDTMEAIEVDDVLEAVYAASRSICS